MWFLDELYFLSWAWLHGRIGWPWYTTSLTFFVKVLVVKVEIKFEHCQNSGRLKWMSAKMRNAVRRIT